MDEIIKREIGILIWSILLAFGTVLFYFLQTIHLPIVLIFFIEFVWYAFDLFLAAIMWHYFKIRKSDLPPKLTEVESVPEAISTEVTPVIIEGSTNTE